jgi:uncharacterized cupredoxin-like copper-binding protein
MYIEINPNMKGLRIRMKRVLLVLVLILIPVLTACGGNKPSTSLEVTLVEFSFTPNSFTVPAGKEITIHLVNNGAVIHDFIIMNLGVSVGEKFDQDDEPNMYWMAELSPSSEETLTFTAPEEPGEYQVVCGIAGHYTAGMIGELTVVADDE